MLLVSGQAESLVLLQVLRGLGTTGLVWVSPQVTGRRDLVLYGKPSLWMAALAQAVEV